MCCVMSLGGRLAGVRNLICTRILGGEDIQILSWGEKYEQNSVRQTLSLYIYISLRGGGGYVKMFR